VTLPRTAADKADLAFDTQTRSAPMHKDEAKGAAKDIKGSIKEGVGKATGNDRLAAEGAADRVAGKVQKGVGSLKDAARDALKR
jgi:uncharacterized protein YjbJ (UPF0337 family)